MIFLDFIDPAVRTKGRQPMRDHLVVPVRVKCDVTVQAAEAVVRQAFMVAVVSKDRCLGDVWRPPTEGVCDVGTVPKS